MYNNTSDIIKLVKETAQKIDDTHEQFLTTSIVKKAKLAANRFPQDSTVTRIYNALLNKKETFISRAELKNYFNTLNTGNSRFEEIFASELNSIASMKCYCESERCDHGKGDDWKTCDRQGYKNYQIEGIGQVCKKCYENYPEKYHKKDIVKREKKSSNEDISPPLNHTIYGAFVSHFDKSLPYKPYGPEMSKKAEEACFYELSSFGFCPKKIETIGGQATTLLCRASYDTPKGENSVFIPVEIRDNKALLPSIFLSVAGFMKLNKNDLETHIKGTAGKRQEINVNAVLNKIAEAKNIEDSVVATAVLKHAIAQANPAQSDNQMVNIVVDRPEKSLPKIEYKVPKEAEKIVESVFSKEGMAQISFGKALVSKAKELTNYLLKKAGYSNSQISVAGSDKEYIYFAVSLAPNMGFKVPVKIAKNQTCEPNYIICNGELVEFSAKSISNMFSQNKSDNKMVAIASPMYDLSENKIVEEIAQAMSEKNYLKAEEALHVLKQSGNKEAFNKGFVIYNNGLKGIQKETSESRCDKQYKTANSVHVMCGHTNLPLYKTYQDERGTCHPTYRKYIEKPETASFAYSKLHFS